jgi:hypothetical protein
MSVSGRRQSAGPHTAFQRAGRPRLRFQQSIATANVAHEETAQFNHAAVTNIANAIDRLAGRNGLTYDSGLD